MDQTRATLILCLAACAAEPVVETSSDVGHESADLPYATEVISFSPGPGAGFGHQHFPGIVLGPPKGYGVVRGSMDVLSLGQGGSIVLGFTPRAIVDGPGPDFIVFENPFWAGDSESSVFAELGRVAVSADGETWFEFDCQSEELPPAFCTGYTPTQRYTADQDLDPELSGGDVFDLSDLGLNEVRFVRITDMSLSGETPSAGFDLDAVGLIHFE